MVMPGPGEVLLIDYDPNLPPAPPTPNIEPEEIYSQENFDKTSQQENAPSIQPYLVTLQFRCSSVGPTNAVITCLNGDAEELLNIGAELIVER